MDVVTVGVRSCNPYNSAAIGRSCYLPMPMPVPMLCIQKYGPFIFPVDGRTLHIHCPDHTLPIRIVKTLMLMAYITSAATKF